MSTARITDQRRLRALAATGLLDAPPDAGLDRLAALAARSIGVTDAFVTLVDADRQVIAGSADPTLPSRCTPLAVSFCQHVVAESEPVIMADARADSRVHDNPVVLAGRVGAYAGHPVRSGDGQVLGSFCVVDAQARTWTAEELAVLADFAAAAEAQIGLRSANARLTDAAVRLAAVLDTTQDAYAAIDADGVVVAWNAAAEKLFGWSSEEAVGSSLTGLIVPERYRRAHEDGLARVRATGVSELAGQRLELAANDRNGQEFPIELTVQVERTGDELRFHAFLHDITEREQQRRDLERERSFLQALLDSMDAGVTACDRTGEVVLFNQVMRGIYGAADGVGEGPRDWRDRYRLYDVDGCTPLPPDRTPLARAFAGEHVDDELTVRYADGTMRRCAARGRPIRDGTGERLGAVVVVQDVTDVHRRDRLHAAQHAALRALADSPSYQHAAQVVVAATGAALGWVCGEYWEVDEAGQEIVRLGSWAADRVDVHAFTGPQRLAFARGQGLAGTVWETGRTEWIVDMATDPRTYARTSIAAELDLHAAVVLPIRSPEAVLGALLFVTDHAAEPDRELIDMLDGIGAHLGRYIERRRAEELRLALVESRRHFDRVVRQISDFIWSVEVLPDGRMLAVYASPNGDDVFGGPLATGVDLRGAVGRLVHPDDAGTLDGFVAALTEEHPAEMEVRIRGFDGVTRWVWFRAVPRRTGQRWLVDGICTNVTERHQLTERREALLTAEREQVRRLRAVDRLKDELVALVTHELRNPIASIHGFVELLLDDEHDLDPEHRRFVGAIARQSSHLQRLVDDLLELARIDAGQVSIEPRPTSLTRLVAEALDNHRPAADARKVSLTSRGADPVAVVGDPFRLRQVLDNLLSNAIKYTVGGGAVTITALRRGPRVVLTVADTGIGIPPDEYPKLFTRFFRASTAVEGKVEGTGLGLAITKAIVERHGGVIHAAPNPGGGTRFTVDLPAAPPEVSPGRPPPS